MFVQRELMGKAGGAKARLWLMGDLPGSMRGGYGAAEREALFLNPVGRKSSLNRFP